MKLRVILVLILFLCNGIALAEHPEAGWINYTGAGSCVSPCHVSGEWTMESMGREVAETIHFEFKGPVPVNTVYDQNGNAISGEYGKINRYCGLPGTMTAFNWIGVLQASNPNLDGGLPGGCARCHPGNGTLGPEALVADNWRAIDCLACHASTYQVDGEVVANYGNRLPQADSSSPTGFRMPLPSGDDLGLATASIVGSPTTESCQRCHLYAGGGYMNKRGHDFMQDDVHAAALSCVDCHETHGHKIAMGRPKPALWSPELYGEPQGDHVSCEWCHSDAGAAEHMEWNVPVPEHENLPPGHLERISCQACHITQNEGLVAKSFNQLERVLTEDGRFQQWNFQSTSLNGSPQPPQMRWYNGTVFTDVQPRGSLADPESKIYPFRRMESQVPVDDATGITLPLKLGVIFNADSLMTNMIESPEDTLGLVDKAIRTGVQQAAQSYPDQFAELVGDDGLYTGSYHWATDEMMFAVDHGVEADTPYCNYCHSQHADFDWTGLGYDGNPWFNEVEDGPLPGTFWLGACYPNPFNNATVIPFQLDQSGPVSLGIYDLAGRLVHDVLQSEDLPAGRHDRSVHADALPSGMYIYRLEAGAQSSTGKMLLLK